MSFVLQCTVAKYLFRLTHMMVGSVAKSELRWKSPGDDDDDERVGAALSPTRVAGCLAWILVWLLAASAAWAWSEGACNEVIVACLGKSGEDDKMCFLDKVQEFFFFKARSLELINQGQEAPIDAEAFLNALYIIDIGQNDINALLSNLPYDQVVAKLPPILAEIKYAVQLLYGNGSRNFWIHGTGALGCLPQKLSIPRKNDSDLDQNGCLSTYNRAAVAFNTALGSLCDQLNVELKNATVVYTDLFAIKYDLVANHTKYGFDSPLMTCCGYGGPPYNYDLSRSCQSSNSTVCADGSKFISWDGVHLTEAANAVVAAAILSSAYSRPKLKFDQFCKAR
ncbi:unnamed protein product [Triticum turgidum subsp. durum]|uniref:GDSL esterase/lipase LIP-4 n=1 Tax=Triticum turgidum subsp. durum TaxID=4567 RepID=A0A9R0PVV6_TRITD|nr:unnamed protein product [Triticum turgidum subsp. durum]